MKAVSGEGRRALVTGGAGFIGSHLVDRLLAEGYQVSCVDNLVLGRMEHLALAQENPAFSLREFDLLDLDELDGLFASEGFDTVFHLAANSDIREGTRSTRRDLELTFLTTFNVLECMRRYGVRQLLFTSSPAVFGQHDGPLEEDSVARPESLYGASKLASEAFIAAFSGLYEIQVWLCRLSNIVGERSTHGILFDFLNKLDSDPDELEVLGDGTQSKPYMYVHDVIDAFFFILQHSRERLNVFNIGPRDSTSVADIAELVLAAYGEAQSISYAGGPRGWKGDVPLYRYCPSRLEALGWSIPCTSTEAIRTAIQRMIETR